MSADDPLLDYNLTYFDLSVNQKDWLELLV